MTGNTWSQKSRMKIKGWNTNRVYQEFCAQDFLRQPQSLAKGHLILYYCSPRWMLFRNQVHN